MQYRVYTILHKMYYGMNVLTPPDLYSHFQHWRSSFAPAAVAFAAATAGSSNPRDLPNMVREIRDWASPKFWFHASESLQWLLPWGGQEEDVNHELGGHHEGAVRAETLGHQAWPGRFIWNNGQFDQNNVLCCGRILTVTTTWRTWQ